MNKKRILKPVICFIEDNERELERFEKSLRDSGEETIQDIILNYPTVYIHNWKDRGDYEVYIGESGNVVRRTKQHYANALNIAVWQNKLLKNKAWMYIIGHEHFNKSLTLDIENRLIHYMTSVGKVKKVYNKNGNPQGKYYPVEEFEGIFKNVWKELHRWNPELFPVEKVIQNSAIFKASPLHKLTAEQNEAKKKIIQKVVEAFKGNKTKQLIFIEGEAGTGKTVLNSSTFYELYMRADELGVKGLKCFLMVNHNEQRRVYEEIVKKLGLEDEHGIVVYRPTSFINKYTPEEPIDVAFVDEAHLLLTQGKQSYTGKNQLQDIIERARVTVVMFDENQILTTEQFWEAQILENYKEIAKSGGNYIELRNQMRMSADRKTIEWIDNFTKYRKLEKIPVDSTGYEIKIFDCPDDMESEIKSKAFSEKFALSRMVATYDWEYSKNNAPKDRMFHYWEVVIGQWRKPWNYELEKKLSRSEKRRIRSLAWAEQPQTIDEIGSTFTIQGFDLNYVGVILGPSVKYRNGEVIFDTEASCNEKAIRNRTLSDGRKEKFGEILIQHEVRVLMTRGVNGLYIYACDDKLREALKQSTIK